jgi:uncharacterized DUF497 family protein
VFQWDTSKAIRNAEKHGVSFAEAATTFDDESALDGPDVSHSFLEARRLRVGRSSAGRILVVAYTVRGAAVRLISARLASRRERVTYAQA